MTTQNEKIVAMVISKAGGMRALGRALGINYQSIQAWKKIPAERVPLVEAATGIPREKLRPDLYIIHHAKDRPVAEKIAALIAQREKAKKKTDPWSS